MKQASSAHSLWEVIVASSALSKIILVGASLVLILCLFIFIYKFLLLREKVKQVAQAADSLHRVSTFNDVLTFGATLAGTVPGALVSHGLTTIKSLLQRTGEVKQKMTLAEATLLEESMDQAADEIVHREYAYLPVLSVTASVGPLVGLFGTISGLIQAFIAIGQERSTDITTIAPGIAEALVTTFAGIVVAIPAFILFHYLINMIRGYERQVMSFEYQFESVIKRLLVE